MAMKKIFATGVLIFLSLMMQAQDSLNNGAQMADLMRSNGKIYVVIVVMLTILAGLIIYMVRLDRKIGRLEKIS